MKHRFWICGGLLLIAAALCFTIYTLYNARQAGERAADLLLQYQEAQSASSDPMIIYDGSGTPAIKIDSTMYIGVLDLPTLDISLPVMKEWSYDALKMAPCRYEGSVSQNNLIIAGHNYSRHFGGLRDLETDDEVGFTDAAGNRVEYRVAEVTRISGKDIDEMLEGEWDLTLFTCTLDSQSRVTVRCNKADGDTQDEQ